MEVTDPRVSKVLESIQHSPDRLPRIEDLAHLANLSPWRLCHLFKQQTGTTMTAYSRSARLHAGAEALALSQRSVKEIAFGLGFRSVSHFVRSFRREFGAPPTASAKNSRSHEQQGRYILGGESTIDTS